MNYNEVIDSLSSLSKEELAQIKARIDFLLLSTNSNSTNSLIPFVEEVFLSQSKKFQVVVPELYVIKKINPFQINNNLKNVCIQIIKLYNELNLQREHIHKLVYLIVDCACCRLDFLEKNKTFLGILHQCKDIKLLIDESFPGYLDAGFFKGMVIG